LRDAPDAGVNTAGVLAHDHEVDVFRSLVLERGLHVGIPLHRLQIDVSIESKARPEQNADFQDAGLDVGMADGAQERFRRQTGSLIAPTERFPRRISRPGEV
jgi:hypothetical protein